jgi:hypothetical protein
MQPGPSTLPGPRCPRCHGPTRAQTGQPALSVDVSRPSSGLALARLKGRTWAEVPPATETTIGTAGSCSAAGPSSGRPFAETRSARLLGERVRLGDRGPAQRSGPAIRLFLMEKFAVSQGHDFRPQRNTNSGEGDKNGLGSTSIGRHRPDRPIRTQCFT